VKAMLLSDLQHHRKLLTRVNENASNEVWLKSIRRLLQCFLRGDGFTQTVLLNVFIRVVDAAEKVMNVLFFHVGVW